MAADSDVLEFPTSPVKPGAAASPANRRGDIHSSLALTPTAATRRAAQTPRALPNANADLASDHQPPSVAPTLSAQIVPSSEPDEIRAIWGTSVNLSETMTLFRGFLLGFKPKYRVQYDRSLNLRPMSLPNPEAGERVLDEEYLRRMRITGETNLNLDMVNLTAYPLAKKLYGQPGAERLDAGACGSGPAGGERGNEGDRR
jgi:DNA replication licensing factor MCM4